MVKSLACLTYGKILLSYYTKLIYHQKRTTDYCTQFLSQYWLKAKILNILAIVDFYFLLFIPLMCRGNKEIFIKKNN